MIKNDRIYKTESILHTTIQTNPPCGSGNKEFCNRENRGPAFYSLTLLFLLVKEKAINLIFCTVFRATVSQSNWWSGQLAIKKQIVFLALESPPLDSITTEKASTNGNNWAERPSILDFWLSLEFN